MKTDLKSNSVIRARAVSDCIHAPAATSRRNVWARAVVSLLLLACGAKFSFAQELETRQFENREARHAGHAGHAGAGQAAIRAQRHPRAAAHGHHHHGHTNATTTSTTATPPAAAATTTTAATTTPQKPPPSAPAGDPAWNSTSSSDWKTAGNWSPSGVPLSTDLASFSGVNPPSGIINIQLKNGATQQVGAISLSSTSGSITIGNNETTGNSNTDSLRVNGFTVNSVANTILSNSTTAATTLTIQNTVLGGTTNLHLLLGNTTNVIQATAGNSIVISSIIDQVTAGSAITFQGGGTLTLSGANTYTGTTTISAGTLLASNIVVSGGNSNLGNASSAVVLGDASNQGTLNYTGGAATYTRGFTINAGGGQLTNSGGALLTVATGGISAGGLFTVGGASSNDISISSIVSGAGGLTKTGADTLTLSGANTYTGATTISAGTLSANKIVVSGGNSSLGNASSAVILGDASNQGTLSYTGGSATYTRGFTINAGGGQLTNAGGGTLTVNTGGISAGGLFTVGGASSNDISISSIISGTGGLTKTGADTLTLSGADTYAGDTTISAGTLNLGASEVIPNGAGKGNVIISSGATLFLNGGFNETINGLSGSGSILVDNGPSGTTLTVGDNNATSAFSGVISEGSQNNPKLALIKIGTGTQTLSGANAYTGVTTISAGTLSVSSLANGGTASGIGKSTNAAANLVFDGGTLQYTGGTVSTNRNFTINTGKTATIDVSTGATNLTISGASTATTGALTKIGSGTLTLSGANTYTGGTSVNAGSLLINNTSGSGTGTGTVTVNNSGTILGGKGTISGPVTVAQNANISPGATANSTAILTTGSLTLNQGANFNVDITGAGGAPNAGITYDQLNVTGTVFLGPTGQPTLSSNLFVNASGLTVSNIGQKFFILDAAGVITGTFAQGATVTSGLDVFTINYMDDDLGGVTGMDISLTLIAVPEPSTWVAGALAFTSLVACHAGAMRRRVGQRRRISCRRNRRT